MNDNLNIFEYILKLNINSSKDLYDFYNKIISFNSNYFIPAVKFEVAYFLYWISLLKMPKNILEIGFGSGASSIFIRKALSGSFKITSLERDHNRVARGNNLLNEINIREINLIHADAKEFLLNDKDIYDLIFIDAVKNEYNIYFNLIKDKVKSEGLIIADNILFNNRVVSENIDKKYLNGTNSIKEYNLNISNDYQFKSFFLNIGDGISLAIKK